VLDNQADQDVPRNDALHLIKKDSLPCPLRGQLKACLGKTDLVHVGLTIYALWRCRGLPRLLQSVPYSIGSYHIDTVTTAGQMVFSDVYRTYNAYAYGPLNDSNYLTKTGLQYRYDPLSDTQPYYQKTATNITTDKAYQEATASPELMANLLNKLWLKASQQPGYRGLPYSPTNPITAADLSPQAMPLLADLLSQILNPVGEIVLSQDGINPDPIVVNNPDKEDPDFCQKYPNATYCKSRDTQIDLSAPDAQTPKLESVPTALNILKPIIDLILPYKNVSIFKPSIQCPKSSFEALNRTWILDAHCDMFESIRSLLSAVMLTVFAVACFRIPESVI
jgi:hypothetical protein